MEELQKFVQEMFIKAGFFVESVVVRQLPEEMLRVDLYTPDAGMLIGESGRNIPAWEAVIKAKARRILEKPVGVTFDINNYRSQREETLREEAKRAAREAVLKKQPVELPAMNAYDRRVVHLELALRPDVATESEGEEPERRVVVKPI